MWDGPLQFAFCTIDATHGSCEEIYSVQLESSLTGCLRSIFITSVHVYVYMPDKAAQKQARALCHATHARAEDVWKLDLLVCRDDYVANADNVGNQSKSK